MEQRIAFDRNLRSARDAIAAARDAVGGLPRPTVSAALLGRIESLTDLDASPKGVRGPATRSFGWRSLAASIIVAKLAASGLTYAIIGVRDLSGDQLIAAAHRRSLLAASPVDVASSDRHTVKPWLDARLGVSPPAPDLATSGFALVGGRVDVLEQQVVPTFVYRHNKHAISLVARPESSGAAVPRGFSSGGTTWCAGQPPAFSLPRFLISSPASSIRLSRTIVPSWNQPAPTDSVGGPAGSLRPVRVVATRHSRRCR